MTSLRVGVCLLALVFSSGCAYGVRDLRLEGVRPLAETDRNLMEADDLMRGRVASTPLVVELSSAEDLRRSARGSSNDDAIVSRCVGRTEIDPRPGDQHVIAMSRFYNSTAPVWDQTEAAATHPSGRFLYTVPLRLLVPPGRDPRLYPSARSPAVNLRTDREDLCLYGRAVNDLRGIWGTNTVVIPHAMIRAALGAGD